MEKIKKIQKNKGAAMIILVFFFMLIGLTILIGIISPTVREFRVASVNFQSKKAYSIAESGAEDMMYRIKNNMDVGTIGEERTLFLKDSIVSIPTEYSDLSGGNKKIVVTGDMNSNQRTVDLILTTTTGVSFNYGVLAGLGGIYLDSGKIYGNVYVNGPITASSSSSNIISGTAISANSPVQADIDQNNGTTFPPPYNIVFGNANATQDIAQSFRVSKNETINKVDLYMRRTTTVPSTTYVKIMNDSNGNVGSTVIAQGTIPASVATSYGWIEVSFTSNPLLETSKTYWLVIDGPTGSSSKNYTIGASSNTYANGLGKIGRLGSSWNNTTPVGLDYYFKLYLGGMKGSIIGSGQWNRLSIGTDGGIAKANTINYTKDANSIYCQSGVHNYLNDVLQQCISGQPDPTYIPFPVSDANIQEWKDGVSSGGTQTGNYTVGPWPNQDVSLGPKKIVGNLTVTSGGVLTLTGNLWVTGNLVLDGGGTIKLDSSYGEDDAVIIVDGTITVTGGTEATGSGTEGSYLMLLSLSDSTSAISIAGGSGAVIAYAQNGTIYVSGGAHLKEATGYRIVVTGNSSITYESGLTNNNFSSGPSGSWSINSWKETAE
jgi:hypothetical protein